MFSLYYVTNVIDKDRPCKIQIVWTDDGKIASLLISDYCHAIFDFDKQAGYCRTGFPPGNGEWSKVKKEDKAKERILTDELINDIFKNKK